MSSVFFISLQPAVIDGSSPGSTYTVVARTRWHLVGVRRIANTIFRIRVTRVDGAPLNLKDTTADQWRSIGFKVDEMWTYMSTVATSAYHARTLIGHIVDALLFADTTLENLENFQTDDGVLVQNQIDEIEKLITTEIPLAVEDFPDVGKLKN